MSEKTERLKQKLIDARADLDQTLDAVGNRWQEQVYSDGAAWNVHQLLLHLTEAERGHLNLLIGIMEGREVVPADFDINRYNKRSVEKKADVSVEDARQTLTETRQRVLEWVDSIEDDALEKTGRHPSMNIFSVSQILKIMALHEKDHARDIRSALHLNE